MDEVLFAYIVVASHALSLVLIRVDSGVQRPFYYMSKSLHETEVHYLPLEKAIFGNSTCYTQTLLLLPIPHSCYFNLTFASIITLEC